MKIITVMSDEHSYHMMQFIRNSILQTPNLDRLAKESTVFDNCYTPCPVCAPARGSFISGLYVNRIGTWDNSTPYDGAVPGLSHYLTAHGRQYVNIGKTHFHKDGAYGFTYQEREGFMEHADIGCFFRNQKIGRIGAEKRFEKIGFKKQESHDDRVLCSSLSWLEEHAMEDDWYLYIGFLDPHFPFYVKKEHWDYFEKRITEVPDALKPPFTSLNESLEWLRVYFKCGDVPQETMRRLLIGYHCAIAELDERIGILLDKVDALGLGNEVVFCYVSDHGEQLGYHGLWWKCCMFEESAHVPLIVRVPGQKPRRITAPVNLVDWFPTVCDYMGLPIPDHLDGYSLRPFVETGHNDRCRDFAFSEYHAHGIPNGMFLIRWKQYKYVYYCYSRPQLFDLDADPGENHDLLEGGLEKNTDSDHVGKPEIMEIAEECHKRLLSICNPYEVDHRAKEFQRKTKLELGIVEYDKDMMNCPVPHPVSFASVPDGWLSFPVSSVPLTRPQVPRPAMSFRRLSWMKGGTV